MNFIKKAITLLLGFVVTHSFAQTLNYSANIDISAKTPSYEGVSAELHGGDESTRSFLISPDGTTIYHIDRSTSEIIQEAITQPFDIASGITLQGVTDTLPDAPSGSIFDSFQFQGMTFNNDGTKIYVISSGLSDEYDGDVTQYSLATPYDVLSGMQYDGEFNVNLSQCNDDDIAFNRDGSLMYVVNDIHDNIHIFSLNVPFDVTGGATEIGQFTYNSAIHAVKMTFSPDGHEMFLAGSYNDGIYQYHLNTPFDLTGTVSYVGYYPFPIGGLGEPSINISPDGTKLFVLAAQSPLYEIRLNDADIFTETIANNGALQGEMIISLTSGSFNNAGGTLTQGVHYSIPNLPAGLSSSMSVYASGSAATLTLSGNAVAHGIANNLEGLIINFEDAAFNGMTAAAVNNSTTYNTGLGISFDEKPSMNFVDTVYYGEVNTADILDVDAFLFGFGVADEDITYTLGGTDASDFTINPSTGVIQFNAIPDFENPVDNNGDNVYEVDITATYLSDTTKSLVVVVTDKLEKVIYASDIQIGALSDDGVSLDANTELDQLRGFAFTPEDSVIYVTNDEDDDRIHAYKLNGKHLSAGTSYLDSYVLPEGSAHRGMRFNHDGTKLFCLDNTSLVYQYTLATPYHLGSITYDGERNFSTEINFVTPTDLQFSPDGTKLYLFNGSFGSSNFVQLSLLNPFDITGEYTVDLKVNFPYSGISGVYLSKNGKRLFYTTGGLSTVIYEYALTSPFDFTKGYAYVDEFEINEFTSAVTLGTDFSEEKLYIGEGSQNNIFQFSLNSPKGYTETLANNGAVSGNGTLTLTGGINFENKSASLTQGVHYTISNLPAGLSSTIQVSADGFSGTLNLSGNASPHTNAQNVEDLIFTFFDNAFTGAVATDVENSIAASSGLPVSFDLQPDFSIPDTIYHGSGKTNIVVDVDAFVDGSSDVDENVTYSISGTDAGIFTIDNATGVLEFVTPPDYSNPADNDMDNNYELTITASFSADSSADLVVSILPFERTLTYSIAMDISADTVGVYSPSLYVGDKESAPTGMTFSKDGTKLFVVGDANNRIIQYSLSTPFDVSTGVFDLFVSINTTQSNTQGIAINQDGSKFFVVGYSPSAIHEYELNTPGDISGGITLIKTLLLTDYMYLASDVNVSPDGSRLFLLGPTDAAVMQFSLNLPFSIAAGIEYETEFSVDYSRDDIEFSPDGRQMFVTGFTIDAIEQYTLATPYDLSDNITLVDTWDYNPLGIYENNPQGLAVNDNGTKLYFVGTTYDSVYQAHMGSSYPFTESGIDPGAVEGSMFVHVSGDQFVNAGGTLQDVTHFTVPNAPEGLTPELSVDASGTLATLTFSGNALNHDITDTLDALVVSFTDAAFVSGDGSGISNSLNHQTSLGMVFDTVFVVISGLTEPEDAPIFYPNPTTGWVYFSEGLTFDMLNATGVVVKSGSGKQVDLSDLPSGLYFIRTRTHSIAILKQ